MIEEFAAWPPPIVDHLGSVYGEPDAIERLGGMSLARVYRARFAGMTVIVKRSPRAAETLFYEAVADRLRQVGIPIPQLVWSAHLVESHWLILEDIPTPYHVPPADRWQPDPRVLALLARLHRASRDWSLDLPASPARAWTDPMNEAALRCFPEADADGLAPRLQSFQREADHLNEGWCWISGDPSPANWGVRQDGSLALYDWELFRRGMPATDVAITVPGLGDRDMYRRTAACYLDAWDKMGEALPWSCDVLERDIALAKLGTVIALLSAHAGGTARVPEEYVARLVRAVPQWIRSLS